MPHFSSSGAAGEAGVRPLDDERADARDVAPLLLLAVAPGEDEEVIGHVGQRDPGLLPGQHPVAVALHGHRLDRPHVAARPRLGQAVAADLLAARLGDEILPALLLGAPAQQAERVEPRVHRHDDAQRRVEVLELLAGQPEADVVHAGAAVLGGDADAQQAERRHPRQDARVEPMLAIEVVDAGGNLAGAPFPDGLLQQALFFRELQVDHPKRLPCSYSCRTTTAAPRSTPSRSTALVEFAANSRCSVLPNRAQTSSSPMSA